jgi:hypothetical protein
METNEVLNQEFQAWMTCHHACMETLAYCTAHGDAYNDLALLCSLRDCAEMCLMCINLIADGSEFVGRACLLCADMCEKCARICAALGQDAQLLTCVEACHACARAAKAIGTDAESYFEHAGSISTEALMQSTHALITMV